jgi:hypothetical protein
MVAARMGAFYSGPQTQKWNYLESGYNNFDEMLLVYRYRFRE